MRSSAATRSAIAKKSALARGASHCGSGQRGSQGKEDERLLLENLDAGASVGLSIRAATSIKEAEASIAVQMIRSNKFDGLTLEQVKHLCKILGASDEYIGYDQLHDLLTLVLDPPLRHEDVVNVWDLSEKRPDGNVSVEVLHRSMHDGNIMQKLQGLQQYTTDRRRRISSRPSSPMVDRKLFKTWVAWRNTRDDALGTLPIAVTSLVVFVFLVMSHLQIAERRLQERALENWVVGWSKDWGGPYLHDHVTSVGFFHTWLKDSGMPCLFQDARPNSAGYPVIHMASSSVIIGDAKLVRRQESYGDTVDEPYWLLNSLMGKVILEGNRGSSDAYEKAAKERLKELDDIGVFNYKTEELRLEWVTYNRRTRMFCLNVIKVVFKGSGFILPSMSSYAVIIEPYPRHQIVRCIFTWTLCGLYCLLLLLLVKEEGGAMLLSMRLGLRGFINYWGFWNAVDWCEVLMGISVIVLWTTYCQVMKSDSIQSLIDDDFQLHPLVMQLNPGRIQQIQDDLLLVSYLLMGLQIVMALNVIAIVLKLLKAFRANERLSAITDTINSAAVDVFHFLFPFTAIFLAWTQAGHALFGNDLQEFQSLGISSITCLRILIGDFGWYVEYQNHPGSFGSGMPRVFMTVWFISFEIVVRLCVVNMLLGIILDRHEQVSQALAGSADAPTLWLQVRRYFERRAATRGFMSLDSVQFALEITGSKMVHPEETVTCESILKAFPDMKREQGEWLMKNLEKEAAAKQSAEGGGPMDGVGEKLEELNGFVQKMADRLNMVQRSALLASRKVDRLEDEQSESSEAPPNAESRVARWNLLIDNVGQHLQEQAQATAQLRAMMKELSIAETKLSARAIPEEKFNDGMLPPMSGPSAFSWCCSINQEKAEKLSVGPLGAELITVRAPKPKVLPPCCGTDLDMMRALYRE